MSTIIPYAAAEAGAPMSAMVPVLYQDTKWAARKIGRGLSRAYRKRKAGRKKRKLNRYPKVGEPMKNVHMKREQTNSLMDEATDIRTLYFQEITDIATNASGEDDRSRQLINCKGIQCTYHFYNKENQPKFLNVAIVSPKHGASGVGIVDFFRANDGTRGTNFSTALTALELHYLPINTDKYHVMKHYRHQLGAESDSGGFYNSDAGKSNYLSKKIWLPVNRQLRYESTLATSCSTPIYVVWWCDRMRSPAGNPVTANLVSASMMHTMFFTDVL